MEGENTGVVVAQQSQPNGQNAAPPQPAPTGRTIDDATWEKYQRYEQQLKGQAPLIEQVTKLGFKSPEDFAPLEAIKTRGIDFRRLAETLGNPKEPEPDPDPTEVIDKRFKEWEDKLTAKERKIAYEQYQRELESESKRLEKLAEELAGETADEYTKYLHKQALSNLVWENAQDFDDGHPLKGTARRPYGEGDFAKLAERIKEQQAKAKGAGMKQIADAASKPVTPKSTAGSQGNQGTTQPKAHTKSDARQAIRDSVAGVIKD